MCYCSVYRIPNGLGIKDTEGMYQICLSGKVGHAFYI